MLCELILIYKKKKKNLQKSIKRCTLHRDTTSMISYLVCKVTLPKKRIGAVAVST